MTAVLLTWVGHGLEHSTRRYRDEMYIVISDRVRKAAD